MSRPVPLWFFLVCLILWLVVMVGFGWTVKSVMAGSDRTGAAGTVALRIASFPSLAKDVFKTLGAQATGDADDQDVRTARDPGADYSAYTPIATAPGIALDGLLIRADAAAIAPGWRLLTGAFGTPEGMENMALLLSPDLTVVNQWVLDEIQLGDTEPQAAGRKLVHGIDILPDGSILFVFDGGASIQRFDACGKRIWATAGDFNHTVNLDDAGAFAWTVRGGEKVVKVAVADGSVAREITMQQVIDANPGIDILELRREHSNDLGANSRNTQGKWGFDAFHLNDAQPLPATMAAAFPQFAPGDLLISARSLNLIFVIDPDTLKVKWWRMGVTQRQHDPDWLPSGRIMAFDNRMSRDYSEIVTIDPMTMAADVIYDGRADGFYSRIRGKVQRLDGGTLVITSPQQGEAFEVAPDGSRPLRIADTRPGSATQNYTISEMRWLPLDFFAPGTACIPAP